MNKTEIFKDYNAFLDRKDKKINGVSKKFAKKHPAYEDENKSNTGCYDCANCTNCYNCYDCTNCYHCYHCTNCYDYCANCYHCYDCYHCTNCYNCNNCYHCNECSHFKNIKKGNKVMNATPDHYNDDQQEFLYNQLKDILKGKLDILLNEDHVKALEAEIQLQLNR